MHRLIDQLRSIPATRLRPIPWREMGLALSLLVGLAIALQYLGGAYSSEFGGHPDEAGHYVTHLMIRDYIAQGFPGHPMRFARNYYNHYPKVALGHWPPVFYLIQSAWSLLFTPARASMLILMAVLTALTATLLYGTLLSNCGRTGAAAASVLFVSLPLVQRYTGMIMSEIPVALITLCATLFFARYLDKEEPLDSAAFGLLAATAILTKGTGMSLAAVPPVGVLLTRRFDLLKRPSFWAPAAIVLVLAGPWTYFTMGLVHNGWLDGETALSFFPKAFPYYAKKLFTAVGAAITVFALVGIGAALCKLRTRTTNSSLWAALVGLLIGVFALHITTPCGFEGRHLIPCLPVIIALAVLGAHTVALRIGDPRLRQPAFAGLLVVCTAGFLAQTAEIPQKGCAGFGPVAERLLNAPDSTHATLLVSSDARGEGMFISEVAMREKRPGHIVRRASKLLAKSSWSGTQYEAAARDAEEILALISDADIDFVVLDSSVPVSALRPHHHLLQQAVRNHPIRFSCVSATAIRRADVDELDGIAVFRATVTEPEDIPAEEALRERAPGPGSPRASGAF